MKHLPKITEVLGEVLAVKPERITMETRLVEDLGADSLDYIDLVIAFEEAFEIDVDDEKSLSCRTVADIAALLEQALAGGTTEDGA